MPERRDTIDVSSANATIRGVLGRGRDDGMAIDPLAVRVGDRLVARVLALAPGVVELQVGSRVLEARTTVPFRLGARVEFRVQAVDPNVELVLLGRATADRRSTDAVVRGGRPRDVLTRVARLGSSEPAWGAALRGVVASLRAAGDLVEHGPAAGRGAQLERFARLFGLDQTTRFASLVRDADGGGGAAALERELPSMRGSLVSSLRALLAEAERATGRERRDNLAGLRELVNALDLVEIENGRRAEAGRPTLVPLPPSAADVDASARAFFARADGDDGSGASGRAAATSIVLLLDLTALGSVRVDLTVVDGAVEARFSAVREVGAEAVAADLDELRTRLQGAGLRVGALRADRVADEAVDVHGRELDTAGRGAHDGVIDVRI